MKIYIYHVSAGTINFTFVVGCVYCLSVSPDVLVYFVIFFRENQNNLSYGHSYVVHCRPQTIFQLLKENTICEREVTDYQISLEVYS